MENLIKLSNKGSYSPNNFFGEITRELDRKSIYHTENYQGMGDIMDTYFYVTPSDRKRIEDLDIDSSHDLYFRVPGHTCGTMTVVRDDVGYRIIGFGFNPADRKGNIGLGTYNPLVETAMKKFIGQYIELETENTNVRHMY